MLEMELFEDALGNVEFMATLISKHNNTVLRLTWYLNNKYGHPLEVSWIDQFLESLVKNCDRKFSEAIGGNKQTVEAAFVKICQEHRNKAQKMSNLTKHPVSHHIIGQALATTEVTTREHDISRFAPTSGVRMGQLIAKYHGGGRDRKLFLQGIIEKQSFILNGEGD